MVNDFWTSSLNGFCSWKEPSLWNSIPDKNISDKIWSKLGTRKIKHRQGSNIIHWGHHPSGKFSMKEAYNIISAMPNSQASPIWTHLWTSQQWPKISHFLWLLLHRRILTWENLTRKGFQGPSRCSLCNINQESIEHLMEAFPFTSLLWDNMA